MKEKQESLDQIVQPVLSTVLFRDVSYVVLGSDKSLWLRIHLQDRMHKWDEQRKETRETNLQCRILRERMAYAHLGGCHQRYA